MRSGVVVPVAPDLPGGPSRTQATGRGWRRSSRGLYVPVDAPLTAHQRVVEVGVVLPPLAAVTGWAALAWLGGRWSSGTWADGSPRSVPVAMSRRLLRPRPGVVLCEERYDPRETEIVDGVRVTTAVRSVCFAMRYAASVPAAVEVVAMAAYDDLVSIAEVREWIDAHPSYTGIERARQAIDLAVENAWSPMEVATGLVWVLEAGRPQPVHNRPLFDLAGRHLVTPDLADLQAGVVGEYDGGVHAPLAARRRDRDRADTYREHELECVRVMEGDLRDPTAFTRRLHAAYARARGKEGRRTWTAEHPAWWVDTSTVERRRALTGIDREIWLRYRDGR